MRHTVATRTFRNLRTIRSTLSNVNAVVGLDIDSGGPHERTLLRMAGGYNEADIGAWKMPRPTQNSIHCELVGTPTSGMARAVAFSTVKYRMAQKKAASQIMSTSQESNRFKKEL